MGEGAIVRSAGVRRRSIAVAVAVLAAAVMTVAAPARAAGCATPGHAGGEWPSYGRDAGNTRFQPDETTIGPEQASSLKAKWFYTVGGGSQISSTPVVVDGCLYVTSWTLTDGYVTALNADTGQHLWTTHIEGNGGLNALVGGVIVGSPAVTDDTVIVPLSQRPEPYAVGLDRATGAEKWRTRLEPNPNPDSFVVAGPVLYDGLVFIGISGAEDRANARGGYAILDASTGALIKQEYVISDEEFAAGYRGASLWSTPAVDAETGFLYVGGGNPASKKLEHRYSNALLKIDLRRTVGGQPNPTFGEIVDAYKGDTDQYYPGLDRQPACESFGDHPLFNVLPWSLSCLQLDLDFGASPNLFVDAQGNKLVGALQKSGVFHAVHADNMQRAWTTIVGAPCFPCNASTSAVDGSKVYVAAVPPGQMVALSKDKGGYQWAAPIGDGIHFHAVSAAFGVVYTLDSTGSLNAFDASNGLPLLKRPLQLDTGQSASGVSSSGITIARNTVYAANSAFLVAYQP